MRRPVAAFALLGAAALAPAARADGLDISAVTDRVRAVIADPAVTGAERTRFQDVLRTLTRADRPGPTDDFAKLEAAASAGRLGAGLTHGVPGAVAVSLDQGLDVVVPAEDLRIAQLGAAVESRARRHGIDAAVRRARRDADAAISERDAGRTDLACSAALRAARAYGRASRAATAAVRGQDRRAPRWRVVLDGRGGSLLSVWVGPGLVPDVYVVGANDGDSAQFLRGGGEGFVRVRVPVAEALWWVTDVPGDGMWACGTGGSVVRYDPATGAVTALPTGAEDATLYGIWGSAPDDVWTVGTSPGEGHTLLHWDGARWNESPTPPDAGRGPLYKLWGTARDDVWACGANGKFLHWDGTAWSVVPTGASEATALLTVHGRGDRVFAVGAVLTASIIEGRIDVGSDDGHGVFSEVRLPASVPSVAGVYLPKRGVPWAVGYQSVVMRRTGGRWRTVPGVPGTTGRDLHSVRIDDSGGVWIAGGDIIPREDDGVLLYYGGRDPAGDVVPQASWRSGVAPVLAATCSEFGCHGGKVPFLFDTQTADAARAGLVGARSVQAPLLRALPGRPSASYLVHKLEDTHLTVGGAGTAMPQGADLLPLQDLNAVRAWILEGAPDSE